jgi:hypothetical protein
MALRKPLILRKLRSSCREGRTAPIQPIVNFLTASFAGESEEGRQLMWPATVMRFAPIVTTARAIR